MINLIYIYFLVTCTLYSYNSQDLVKNKRTLGVPKGTVFGGWLKNSPRDIVRRAEKVTKQLLAMLMTRTNLLRNVLLKETGTMM